MNAAALREYQVCYIARLHTEPQSGLGSETRPSAPPSSPCAPSLNPVAVKILNMASMHITFYRLVRSWRRQGFDKSCVQ